MSKLFDDDFIEVDENELLLGDEGINIPPNITGSSEEENERKEDTTGKASLQTKETNEEDLLDVDDDVISGEGSGEGEGSEEEENEEDPEGTEEAGEEGEEEEEVTNEFTVFGSILAEKGFFPNASEEDLSKIESIEDVSDLLAGSLNATFNEWKDGYKRNLIPNLVAEGYISNDQINPGVNISNAYSEEQIRGDINTAKDVIRKYYKDKNVTENVVNSIIENTEDLETTALELNQLNIQADEAEKVKLAEKLKRQEEEQIRQRQEFNERIKKNTFEYDEFIPGKKLRKADKEEVFLNIQPVLNKVNGDLSKYAPMLAYLDKYGILDGDFSKLIKTGKSQGISKMEQILKEKRKNTGRSTGTRKSSNIFIDDSNVPNIFK
jgi:hypothetical protein